METKNFQEVSIGENTVTLFPIKKILILMKTLLKIIF